MKLFTVEALSVNILTLSAEAVDSEPWAAFLVLSVNKL